MIIPIDYSLLEGVDSFQLPLIVSINDEKFDLDDGLRVKKGNYGCLSIAATASGSKFSYSLLTREPPTLGDYDDFYIRYNDGDRYWLRFWIYEDYNIVIEQSYMNDEGQWCKLKQ